jgi:hypothetical protein
MLSGTAIVVAFLAIPAWRNRFEKRQVSGIPFRVRPKWYVVEITEVTAVSGMPCGLDRQERPSPHGQGRLLSALRLRSGQAFAWTAEAAVATWAVKTLQSFVHACHCEIIRED